VVRVGERRSPLHGQVAAVGPVDTTTAPVGTLLMSPPWPPSTGSASAGRHRARDLRHLPVTVATVGALPYTPGTPGQPTPRPPERSRGPFPAPSRSRPGQRRDGGRPQPPSREPTPNAQVQAGGSGRAKVSKKVHVQSIGAPVRERHLAGHVTGGVHHQQLRRVGPLHGEERRPPVPSGRASPGRRSRTRSGGTASVTAWSVSTRAAARPCRRATDNTTRARHSRPSRRPRHGRGRGARVPRHPPICAVDPHRVDRSHVCRTSLRRQYSGRPECSEGPREGRPRPSALVRLSTGPGLPPLAAARRRAGG
jgi:hypothetical protein